jgi:hypothetical protein
MTKLFLLKKDFKDSKLEPVNQPYYCDSCALVEGILSYFPHLRNDIEVIYVDFIRPRKVIVDLIGEDHQGCPVLVTTKADNDGIDTTYFNEAGDSIFINSTQHIMQYLGNRYKISIPHP